MGHNELGVTLMKRTSNTEPIPPPNTSSMPEPIHYSSADGCPHCLHFFTATNPSPDTPIVLLFPAMGIQASNYFKLAESFNLLDIHFACTDLRGNGPLHTKPSWFYNFGYQEMLQQDWPAAIHKLKELYPDNPIFLMGHSLGGQLSVCFAALNPHDVEGIIMVASGTVYYKAYHQKMRTYLGSQFLSIFSHLSGYLPGKLIGFGGREARQMMRDWAYNARTGRYRMKQKNGYKVLDGFLTQMKKPVLAISFDGDKLAPHSATVKFLDKLSRASKLHIRTSSLELKTANVDHFNWVKYSDKLTPKISTWISQQGA
jgi:predicted alpha/beta hydrolase